MSDVRIAELITKLWSLGAFDAHCTRAGFQILVSLWNNRTKVAFGGEQGHGGLV